MIFNKHYELEGRHAFLSPSSYHWIRYSDEKLDERFITSMAAHRGTEMHKLANDLIRLRVRLPTKRTTINLYVNDAINYKMTPEQVLYFSDNCFGTADALGFRANTLRVHDLKTGESPASFDQLLVYAALFCLEYRFKPFEINYDLRLYQSNEVVILDLPHQEIADSVAHIMSRIQTFDKRINELRMEAS